MSQQRAYTPLTEEQKIFVKKFNSEKTIDTFMLNLFSFWFFMVLLFLVYVTNESHLLYFMIILSGVIFGLVINYYRYKVDSLFLFDIQKLYACDDPCITGLLISAVLKGRKEERSLCIKTLIPLLYSLNNREAAEAFTPNQRVMLRQIATNPYWRKNEPDLVGATLVALVALEDEKSKKVLQKLASHSWETSEKWVGQAAVMCLEQWGNRWQTPHKLLVKPSTAQKSP